MTDATVQSSINAAVGLLRAAGVEDPVGDARHLMAHALLMPRGRLTLHLGDFIDPHHQDTFDRHIAARLRRQPVSQITGQRLFWGRSFRVTPDVLDPRPETEVLVAAALDLPFESVLDLGIGTGCIMLTLLLERPGTRGVGVEVSPQAYRVAWQNRQDYAMEGRMVLHRGSWYDPVDQSFDLIVSNPPYISAAEMAGLSPEVRDHEPHLALTPGGDGLDAYRAITAGAMAHLTAKGHLLVEIGATQANAVLAMMQAAGLVNPRVLQDMDGRGRVIQASRPA